MDKLDLIIGPLYFILVIIAAFLVRPIFTDGISRKYFIPALTLKMLGAILMGILYFYYYGGGDTALYYYGSTKIFTVFLENPLTALKIIFSDGTNQNGLYSFTSQIPFYSDSSSFFVTRITSIFGIITMNSYAGIAILFSVFSFSGTWALFTTFYKLYPTKVNQIAIACLFVPSVIFWGSGILKDTLTFGALGWLIWAFARIFSNDRKKLINVLVLVFSVLLVFHVKKYILFCVIPALLVWLYMINISKIKFVFLRRLIAPFLVVIMAYLSFEAVKYIGENDARYSLSRIAQTAAITAYDIRYWTGKDAGSGYDIGEIESTWDGLLRRAPAAINVTLFRPYLWEVKNPLMSLAAVESSIFIILMIGFFWKGIKTGFRSMNLDAPLLFCLVFALSFAFAVGVSTYNFGTLMRYKIPIMPFFLMLIFLLQSPLSKKKID